MKRPRRFIAVSLFLLAVPVPARAEIKPRSTRSARQAAESRGESMKSSASGQVRPTSERSPSNSDIPLVPASNLKVLTTSAAWIDLGPDLSSDPTGFQNGDLILIGDGDPSFRRCRTTQPRRLGCRTRSSKTGHRAQADEFPGYQKCVVTTAFLSRNSSTPGAGRSD